MTVFSWSKYYWKYVTKCSCSILELQVILCFIYEGVVAHAGKINPQVT